MAEEKMKNPYTGDPEDTVAISKPVCWSLSIIFLLLCITPPLFRNLSEASQNGWVPYVEFFRMEKGDTLLKHIQKFETRLEEDANFADASRSTIQSGLTRVFREGNNKVVMGEDGWLYFRPALDALTGYGPIKPEPDTVAKDPNRPPWNGPLEVITGFAEQLRELDCDLYLVPIPVKPMIHPEPLGIAQGKMAPPVFHEDSQSFFEQLENAGVRIIRLDENLPKDKSLFMKQDTHWTPEFMSESAKLVAERLRKELELPEAKPYQLNPVRGSNLGDLVGRLGIDEKSTPFEPEKYELQQVLDSREIVSTDQESPLVILGDSFTNIFHQPGLGFEDAISEKENEESIGAGFAQHLTYYLGFPLDVIAINGQAATGVRKALAGRSGSKEMMRSKKAVVWAIAARDLFLSETPARQAQVNWERVEFNDRDPFELAPIKVKATVTEKSPIEDPSKTPYKTAIYEARYKIDEVLEGNAKPGDGIIVRHYAFKLRKLTKEGALSIGDQVELKLIDWQKAPSEARNEQSTDLGDFELTPYWANEFKSLTGKKPLPIGVWFLPLLVGVLVVLHFARKQPAKA